MARTPKFKDPNNYGAVRFSDSYGRYEPDSIPSRPSATLPSNMTPDSAIDTTFDHASRDEIIANGQIPEVLPAFVGLQHLVAEKRIWRLQSKIERLEESQR